MIYHTQALGRQGMYIKAFNVKFRDVDWVDIFRFPSYTSGVYLTIYSLCVQSRLLTLFRIAHFTARSCFEGNYYVEILYFVKKIRNPCFHLISFVQIKLLKLTFFHLNTLCLQ